MNQPTSSPSISRVLAEDIARILKAGRARQAAEPKPKAAPAPAPVEVTK